MDSLYTKILHTLYKFSIKPGTYGQEEGDPPPPPTARIISRASLSRAQDSIPNWSSAQPDCVCETYRRIHVDKSGLCQCEMCSCICLLPGESHAGTMWRSEPKDWLSCDGNPRHSLQQEKGKKRRLHDGKPPVEHQYRQSGSSIDMQPVCIKFL